MTGEVGPREDTEIAISWNIILELPGQGLFGALAKKLLVQMNRMIAMHTTIQGKSERVRSWNGTELILGAKPRHPWDGAANAMTHPTRPDQQHQNN